MKKLVLFALVILSTAAFANTVVYSQPFDQTGNLYASQNDPVSFGLFAQVYDNFTLATPENIIEIQWTGGYFNGNPTAITAWTVQFYSDNAGQPGTLLAAGNWAGNGGETFLGTYGGFPVYTYDITFGTAFPAAAGTQYWVSVYPDVTFPPQWGWASAFGGDGISYQDFFGTRSQLSVDMAFNLLVGQPVPEPGIIFMMGAGALGVAGVIRRKLF